jgi:hypothetical protein
MTSVTVHHVALIEIYRLHFARLWKARHDPTMHQGYIREALKDNIAGQRGFKEKGWTH